MNKAVFSANSVLVAVCVVFGASWIDARQGSALSATPGPWSVLEGVRTTLETPPKPKRRTVRLGLGGDIALGAPIAGGLVVSGRDSIAALTSDRALAQAALMPQNSLRTLAPPPEAMPPDVRVAALDAAASLQAPAMGGAQRAVVDADLAAELGLSLIEGKNRLAYNNADEELYCLAEAIYFEARGESIQGQAAVAEVVLNRVDSQYWPDTVCGVVNQGSERTTGCQFSYTCDGKPENVDAPRSWDLAERIARLFLAGAPRRITDHATHYHADYVDPRWAKTMDETAVVGTHIFYRRLLRVARSEDD
ncbi:MAG: cell wall hydrolase [Pseudomonadota bacterium]